MKQITWNDISKYVGKTITCINSTGEKRKIFVDRFSDNVVVEKRGDSERYLLFDPKNEKESTVKVFVD